MISSEVRTDLISFRRQARELTRKVRHGDVVSQQFIATHAPDVKQGSLAVSQLAVARAAGYASWAKLKQSFEKDELDRLFTAAANGNVSTAKEILRDFPHFAKSRNDNGSTLLLAAVESNSPKMAQLLVRSGVPMTETLETSAHTALSWALTVGNFEFANGLVGAGYTPDLFCAAGLGDLKRTQAFWNDGELSPHPSITGSSRFTIAGERLPRPPEREDDQVSDALYIACRQGHLEVAEFLLTKGASPNFRGYMGATCLHWAEFSAHPTLPDLLRSNGGSDDVEDYALKAKPKPFVPICWAAFGMVERLRSWLDRHPEDVHARGGYGTPLNSAAWQGQLGTTRLLVERGADIEARNAAGLTALEVARHQGFHDLASYLEGVANRE